MTPLLSLHLTTPPSPSHSTSPLSPPTPHSDPGLQFRRKILYLESLNINSVKALTLNPTLRTSPLSSLLSVEQTLTSAFHIPRSSLGRILDMFPSLLTSAPSSHLLPTLAFLSDDVPLSPPLIPRAVTRCPRLLTSDIHLQLKPALSFLRGVLGHDFVFSPQSTVLLVSSVSNTLIPKLEFLSSGLGFRDDDVVRMVRRSPALLTYSVENNLKPKLEYFVREMRGDVREIRSFPQYFSFSLENKIAPRHRLLVEYGISMSLRDMLQVSDGEFNVRLLEMRLRVPRL